MVETESLAEYPTGQMARDEVSVLQRRETAVRMRSQGQSLRAIASQVGVSIQQVSQDLKWVRQEWMRRIIRNKAAWIAETLERLDTLTAVAWEKFYASDAASVEKAVETSEKGTKSRRSRKTRKCDPRFLSIVLDTEKFRANILGLGDKTAVDRVDEVLGKKQPKLLVVRDRAQLESLVDVTQMVDLDIRGPKSYGDRLRKKPLAIEGQEDNPDPEVPTDEEP